jgi:hypothetical protein
VGDFSAGFHATATQRFDKQLKPIGAFKKITVAGEGLDARVLIHFCVWLSVSAAVFGDITLAHRVVVIMIIVEGPLFMVHQRNHVSRVATCFMLQVVKDRVHTFVVDVPRILMPVANSVQNIM